MCWIFKTKLDKQWYVLHSRKSSISIKFSRKHLLKKWLGRKYLLQNLATTSETINLLNCLHQRQTKPVQQQLKRVNSWKSNKVIPMNILIAMECNSCNYSNLSDFALKLLSLAYPIFYIIHVCKHVIQLQISRLQVQYLLLIGNTNYKKAYIINLYLLDQ